MSICAYRVPETPTRRRPPDPNRLIRIHQNNKFGDFSGGDFPEYFRKHWGSVISWSVQIHSDPAAIIA